MVTIFLYDKWENTEFIEKISTNYQMSCGYVIIRDYDSEKHILEISNCINKNNKILYGKIVSFQMNLDEIVKKINAVEPVDRKRIDTIWANKLGGGACKTFIIY